MSFSANSQLVWNGSQVKVNAYNTVKTGIWLVAKIIEGQAISLAPVDTSRLKGSIISKRLGETRFNPNSGLLQPGDQIESPSEDLTVFTGTAVIYGPYQEFGTNRMTGQPFLRPAFDLATGKSLTIVEEEGKRVFKEYL